jgi:AGCS family alanine or glycine:cation symporter
MAIPNLIALLLLSKVIKQETDRYFEAKKIK